MPINDIRNIPDLSRISAVPKTEKIIEVIRESLLASGTDPEAFDILPSPYCLVAPAVDGVDQYLPCFVVVAKVTGMAFFFPTLGPNGLYNRAKEDTVQ